MEYSSCKKLIDVLVLNFKAMLWAQVKVRKKDFCMFFFFAGKTAKVPWQSCCKKKFQAVTLTVVTESTYVQDCVQNLQVFPSTFLAVLSCLNVVLFEGCWIVSSNFEPVEMRSGVCETQTGKKWFKIHFSSSNAISFGPEANKASQQYVLRNSLHGKRILFCKWDPFFLSLQV